ncbi:MAG: PIG-L family deacetylase [Candidatus Vogelbacteria bacterium]|nr:PIG-L family deacetylase [Candidatus Vogelbacteria bacterium]
MRDKKTVLVIVAHPDDEVLGCGGAIVKHIRQGDKVFLIALADGVSSRKGYKFREKRIRSEEFEKSAGILGISKTFYFGFKDQCLGSIPLLKIIKQIEKVKCEIHPDIVYTHYRNDLNVDHRITFNAVLTACRPLKGSTVNSIFAFEVLSSTEWNYPNYFSPNVYVDISKVIDVKIKAMQAYQSEIRSWPHPRSLETIKVLAQKRGCEVGLEFAEAFELIREISL